MNEYEIMLAGQKLKFLANAIFKFLVGAAVFCACMKYILS
jgi:hypothetical protein